MRVRSGSILLTFLIPLTLGPSCEPSAPEIFPLTLGTTGTGAGTVTASPAPTSDDGYTPGTTVTITATPAANSEFIGWDDGEANIGHSCTQPKNPCTEVMDDRRSVLARFAPNAGAPRFDGPYTGKIVTPANGDAGVEMTIVNGVVQGKNVPLYGSVRAFSGTVTASGAFTATINPGIGSNCATNLSGTIVTSVVDGITTAKFSGTWQVVSTGGVGCGASPPGQPLPGGSWSATRDAVHVDKQIQ